MPVIAVSDPNLNYLAPAPNQTIVLAPDVLINSFSTNEQGGTVFVNYGKVQAGVEFDNLSSGEFINRAGGAVFDGARLDGDMNVRNAGVILANTNTGAGIVLDVQYSGDIVVNSGHIFGPLAGIRQNSETGTTISINNSGEIRSDGSGIELNTEGVVTTLIVNTGTIIGRSHAIHAHGDGRLDVTNAGALLGNVTATSVNLSDKLINNGSVTGNVSLGTGVDLYQGTGSVSGFVNGEGGSDTLIGGASADRLNGGSEVDLLTGNGGSDTLVGAAGTDTLAGGLGIDVMAGGANADFFVFNTAANTASNRDVLNDFVAADDTLRFENAVFTKLGNAGVLNAQFLRLGSAPLDADDHLIYNKATGVLTYDVNGNAAGGAQQVAAITTKPTLALGDFVVI
jgi:Ca2+-binding RTX toxin-like protein